MYFVKFGAFVYLWHEMEFSLLLPERFVKIKNEFIHLF
jgi:hypothetical protein